MTHDAVQTLCRGLRKCAQQNKTRQIQQLNANANMHDMHVMTRD